MSDGLVPAGQGHAGHVDAPGVPRAEPLEPPLVIPAARLGAHDVHGACRLQRPVRIVAQVAAEASQFPAQVLVQHVSVAFGRGVLVNGEDARFLLSAGAAGDPGGGVQDPAAQVLGSARPGRRRGRAAAARPAASACATRPGTDTPRTRSHHGLRAPVWTAMLALDAPAAAGKPSASACGLLSVAGRLARGSACPLDGPGPPRSLLRSAGSTPSHPADQRQPAQDQEGHHQRP